MFRSVSPRVVSRLWVFTILASFLAAACALSWAGENDPSVIDPTKIEIADTVYTRTKTATTQPAQTATTQPTSTVTTQPSKKFKIATYNVLYKNIGPSWRIRIP